MKAVAAGAVGLPAATDSASAESNAIGDALSDCRGGQLEPGHAHEPCGGSSTTGCPGSPDYDDELYEKTRRIVRETRSSLQSDYATVGTLIDEGYVPYFDIATPGSEGGFSHWLNPEFVGDSTAKPDPAAPESVLIDNRWWRPIGAMYVATDGGDPVDDPSELWGYERDGEVCSPWHAHDGFPGRFAWWYYRQVYESEAAEGTVPFPCVTPCMLHVWIYPAPAGPHGPSGDAPLPENRGGPPANDPGFSADAVPGEDDLSLETVPEDVRQRAMSDRLREELELIDDLPPWLRQRTTVDDLERTLSIVLE
jgi:hypothetical protein